MSKSEVKPKEFWLREEYKNEKYEFFSCEIATRKPNLEAYNESDFRDSLHVIEYATYQSLQKENERLLKTLIEVRNYIANSEYNGIAVGMIEKALKEEIDSADYAESNESWIESKNK